MSIIVTSRGRSGDAFGKMGSVFVPMQDIMQSRATPAGLPLQQRRRLRPREPQRWRLPSRMAMSPLVCQIEVFRMTNITAARLARSEVVYGRMDTACVRMGDIMPSRVGNAGRRLLPRSPQLPLPSRPAHQAVAARTSLTSWFPGFRGHIGWSASWTCSLVAASALSSPAAGSRLADSSRPGGPACSNMPIRPC